MVREVDVPCRSARVCVALRVYRGKGLKEHHVQRERERKRLQKLLIPPVDASWGYRERETTKEKCTFAQVLDINKAARRERARNQHLHKRV